MFEKLGSSRLPAAPNDGVNGVRGVLGVEIYRPPHFGQRIESSVEVELVGRALFGFPALRGWYR